MPGPRVQSLALMGVPQAWQVPSTVEVRRGVPQGGTAEIVAFRNKRFGEACSALASVLDESKPLPEWMQERVRKIA